MPHEKSSVKSKKRRKVEEDEREVYEKKKKKRRTENEHVNGLTNEPQEEMTGNTSVIDEKEQRRKDKEEKRRRKEEKQKRKEAEASSDVNGAHSSVDILKQSKSKHNETAENMMGQDGEKKKKKKHKGHRNVEDEADDSYEVEQQNGLVNGENPATITTTTSNLVIETMSIDGERELEVDVPLETPNGAPSGLHLITTSIYLPVPSVAVSYPLNGAVANSLTPLLLKYHPPFRGFILTFQNPRSTKLSDGEVPMARIHDEYSSSYIWVTVDFIVFRPNHGIYLKGEVTVHSASHLSMVVWNFFSASVERKRLPRGWKWVEEEMTMEKLKQLEQEADDEGMPKWKRKRFIQSGLGSWYDAKGDRVEGEILFRALDFDVTMDKDGETSMLSIEGSLVSEERDQEIDTVV